MRVMCASDTGLQSKIRTISAMESFLLMEEWHPRSSHFPVDSNGWGDDMVDMDLDGQMERPENPMSRIISNDPAMSSDTDSDKR